MAKKYFGTDGIRGAINSKNINGDMFFKFGLASGTFFKSQKKRKQTAIIAKDTRLSGYTLEPALVSGFGTVEKTCLSIVGFWLYPRAHGLACRLGGGKGEGE